MAEDLTPTPMGAAPRGNPYVRRFRAVYAALALIVLASIALTVLLVARADRPQPFSSFKPDVDDPVERSQAIADFVSGRYTTAPGGPQLVRVDAGEDDKPALPTAPQVLAVGTAPPGLVSYEDGNILFFRMCAEGPECALSPQQDAAVYGTLLARQARELALYGLRYVPEASFVIVILPGGFTTGPDPKNLPKAAHLFRRSDLEDQLDRPITRTLAEPVPTVATLTPAEADAIEARESRTRYTLQSGVDAANTLNVYTLTPLF